MYSDRLGQKELLLISNVNELVSHLRASGGSLVPDTLMELRDVTLLKKCLNDGGTSLPFLQERHRLNNVVLQIKSNSTLSFYRSCHIQKSL